MRVFKKVFKIKMLEELQYKYSYISGIICQFAFGFMYIMLYSMFFKSGIPQGFNYVQMASYVWLGQACYALFSFRDCNKTDITNAITSGNVCNQMIKPIGLYRMWFYQVMCKSVTACLVRAVPILLVAAMLPKGMGMSLPCNFTAFILFAISLILGVILVSAIKMIIYLISLHLLDARGVFCVICSICEFFAGQIVAIPLLPNFMQKIFNFMPFRYVCDLPYRIYIGNLNISTALFQIGIQIIWIVSIIAIGSILLDRKSKKLVVQGG